MTKKITSLFLAWLLILSQTLYPQELGGGGNKLDGGLGGAGSVAATPYSTLSIFERQYEKIRLTLNVLTRGTNDSLDVIVQTNPFYTSSQVDTTLSPWVTLTRFGGIKTATGKTVFSFPTGTVAVDSVREYYRFVRILYRHSVDSALATDTSRWVVYMTQEGGGVK